MRPAGWSGIFTDSDLARLFERRQDALLDRPIGEVMTADPVQVTVGATVAEAVEAMKSRKISELPVVDAVGRPVGLIDLTDLIGLVALRVRGLTGMAIANPDDLAGACSKIELLVLDVDGVLTDGVIAVDDNGVETKHFHVRDGSGIALWRKAGKKVAILSGRSARSASRSAPRELGIGPVVQGSAEKGPAFLEIVASLGFHPDQACHMGDDLADLPALIEAGLAACPGDAAAEVIAASDLVAKAPGGRGAVREVVEAILRAQGRWDALAAGFAARSRSG